MPENHPQSFDDLPLLTRIVYYAIRWPIYISIKITAFVTRKSPLAICNSLSKRFGLTPPIQ